MFNKKYDVIIIGAGIGGLVCGCYLTKAGKKVLIVEKNKNPGGYCRSFKANNFNFDLCARSLSSVRSQGSVGRIIKELELSKKLKFERNNPSDIIVTSTFTISFWNDFNKTIDEFKCHFPEESQEIELFFNYINNTKNLSSLVTVTFADILNKYFTNSNLKMLIALPIFGNIGLPASRVSACSAIILYRELMLDGGYHPEFGMGQISDVLAERYKEYGGEIIFSSKAKRILLENNYAVGVEDNSGRIYRAKYIVSDIDARQTFLDLIYDKSILDSNFLERLNQLKPSLSHFILYLGLDSEILPHSINSNNIWYMPTYNLEEVYQSAISGKIKNLNWLLYSIGKDRKSIMAFSNISYLSREFWQKNKIIFTNHIMKILEERFPGISDHVMYKSSATPITLSNWTSSFMGASYGWEASPLQIAQTGFSQKTPIKNLYLCSQWTTLAYGVAGVSYLGRDVAQSILKKENDQT